MAKVIGIDLGTTNSCVAVMDGVITSYSIHYTKLYELNFFSLTSVSKRVPGSIVSW